MSISKIANQLIALCKEGKNEECIDALYDNNVESVESATPPGQDATTRGIEEIRARNKWWSENHEVHSASVEGPWPHQDDRFAVRFTYDITNKLSGTRMTLDEIAVYHVKNEKIVREEFFYQASPE